LSSFLEIPENAVPFVTAKFRKNQTRIFIEWKAPINLKKREKTPEVVKAHVNEKKI